VIDLGLPNQRKKERHKTTCGGEQGTSRRPPTTQRGVDSGFEERTRCPRPEQNPRPIGAIPIKSLDETGNKSVINSKSEVKLYNL